MDRVLPLLSRRMIGEHHDSGRKRLAFDQLERLFLSLLGKEAFSATQHHWKHHETVFVYEVALVKRLDQLPATENQNVLPYLLLQSREFASKVAREQRSIPGHIRKSR